MRKIFLFSLILIIMQAAFSIAADNSTTLWYKSPPPGWEKARESWKAPADYTINPENPWNYALPIGNGRLGAMVFGGISVERIQLNEETLRGGGPQIRTNDRSFDFLPEVRKLIFEGKNDEAGILVNTKMLSAPPRCGSYQTAGDLWLDFHNIRQADNYRRELDLQTGIAAVRFTCDGVNYTREVFASAPDSVIVMHITADKPGSISCDITINRPEGADTWVEYPARLVMRGSEQKFFAKADIRTKGGSVSLGDGKDNRSWGPTNGKNVRVENADEVLIIVAVATGYIGPYDQSANPDSRCDNYLANIKDKTYSELRATHITDHKKLFDRVSINLGDSPVSPLSTDERQKAVRNGSSDPQLAALYFQYGRYLMMASSRPGTMPPSLQGIWNENVRPIWGSQYWLNLNEEMNYWPVEVANLSECHTALFDFMDSLYSSGARTAQNYFKARGWTTNLMSDGYGFTEPGYGMHGYWPMTAAWLCRDPWEHYLFTGDKQFLRERAYPLMRDAALFLLDYMTTAPAGTPVAGMLVTNPSQSPENSFVLPGGERGYLTYASTVDISIIRDLFGNCITAIDILGIENDRELQTELRKAVDRLPPFRISSSTGKLLEWVDDYEEQEPGHRHYSHLYGFHPADLITKAAAPNLVEAVRKSFDSRIKNGGGHTGWSRAWAINLAARLEDGEGAGNHIRELLSKYTMPNFFDTHPIGEGCVFQIDGNFGGTAGIAEMLIQSHETNPGGKAGRLISLLPSVPASWKTGYVKGLKARGGFEVSQAWKDGKLFSAEIKSALGGPCAVKAKGKLSVSCDGKKVKFVKVTQETIEFDTIAGMEYILEAK